MDALNDILLEERPADGVALLRLHRAVGKFRALQLLLTGAPITAQQPLAMGLAGEVVPDAEVEPRALTLAVQMAQGPQQALQFIKEAVIDGMSLPLDQVLQLERKSFQLLFATSDKVEGIRARLEKRPAKFG